MKWDTFKVMNLPATPQACHPHFSSNFFKILFILLGLQDKLRNEILWYRYDAHTSGQLLS